MASFLPCSARPGSARGRVEPVGGAPDAGHAVVEVRVLAAPAIVLVGEAVDGGEVLELHEHRAAREVEAALDVFGVGAEVDQALRPAVCIVRVKGDVVDVVERDVVAASPLCKVCAEVEEDALVEEASLALGYKDKFMVLVACQFQEFFHVRQKVV